MRRWTVNSLDGALAQVVRAVRTVCSPGGMPADVAAAPRCIIANTSRSSEGSGLHWFTIVYCVRRRVPMAAVCGGPSGTVALGRADEVRPEAADAHVPRAAVRAKQKAAFAGEAGDAKRPRCGRS